MARGTWWAKPLSPGGGFSICKTVQRYCVVWASPVAQQERLYLLMQETQVRPLGQEDPLEKEMATHVSILAWRIL